MIDGRVDPEMEMTISEFFKWGGVYSFDLRQYFTNIWVKRMFSELSSR